MLRVASLILTGTASTAALTLARNLLVARLIPVADYGVAATFAVAMAAVEMATTLGLQQQIVQDRAGDDARLQAAMQGFQLLRGALAALALLALAGPLAAFLGIPEAAWAYRWLALVPLLNAAQHLDIHRLGRRHRFGPLLWAGALPAAVALALVWPLAAWLEDWRVMLWTLLAQAMLATLVSHLSAERPWRLRLDPRQMRDALAFGWPILANAVLMFAIFHGDKLIVGRIAGMASLGVFALGVTLTLSPALVIARTAQTAALPRLSRAAEAGALTEPARRTCIALLAAGTAFAGLAALAGPATAPWLASTGYAALPALLAPLCILQGIRLAKTGPGVAALALGQTGNAMAANLPRVAALGVGAGALARGASIETLIWIGCVGEALGVVVAFALLARRAGVAPPWPELAAWAAALAAAAMGWWPAVGAATVAMIGLALRAVRPRKDDVAAEPGRPSA